MGVKHQEIWLPVTSSLKSSAFQPFLVNGTLWELKIGGTLTRQKITICITL
jgi:hypothetical protein